MSLRQTRGTHPSKKEGRTIVEILEVCAYCVSSGEAGERWHLEGKKSSVSVSSLASSGAKLAAGCSLSLCRPFIPGAEEGRWGSPSTAALPLRFRARWENGEPQIAASAPAQGRLFIFFFLKRGTNLIIYRFPPSSPQRRRAERAAGIHRPGAAWD